MHGDVGEAGGALWLGERRGLLMQLFHKAMRRGPPARRSTVCYFQDRGRLRG